ncbi:vacuolar protein sorting protein VPS50 [Acrasis kona]|uniref:Vacuolar protein sorting protein VPS50 n=1 Tax=Acrasis kona TaxID=1008807 RepID=A0AAW2Z018_9EUKA
MDAIMRRINPVKTNKSPATPENRSPLGKDEVDKMTIRQAYDTINTEYFDEEQSEDFDPIRFLLTRDDDLWNVEKVELELSRHEKGLAHINKELSATVMNNYTSFVQGMTQIQEVGKDLDTTAVLCVNGRKRIAGAKDNAIKNGLTVISKYRKRKSLIRVHQLLNKLKVILGGEKQLGELLTNGDYPSAIKLMTDHHAELSQWKMMNCVKQLDQSMQLAYEKVAKQMDDALITVLTSYDPTSYDRILTAYQLLGQKDVVIFMKIKNFVERSSDVSGEVVMSYVQARKSRDSEAVFKMKFAELCKNVHYDDILPCLLQIFSVVSDIMHNYHQLHQFHQARHVYLSDQVSELRRTLWDSIQNRLSLFIASCEFSHFKFDRFLQVHHAVNMFCELGEEFCESDSHQLRGSLNNKSRMYFMNHHRGTLDNFATMVETFESWSRLDASLSLNELCPEITQKSSHLIHYNENAIQVRKFLILESESNPFRTAAENGRWTSESKDVKNDSESEDESESSSDDEDDDDDDEDYEDYEEEKSSYSSIPVQDPNAADKKKKKKRRGKSGPVVTVTSRIIVKSMGEYVQAMEVLQADEVFNCFTSLYKFYLYTVYAFFANFKPDADHTEGDFIVPETDANIPEHLRGSLRGIREALNKAASGSSQSTDDVHFKIPKPSHTVQIHSGGNLYGLVERITAAESLESLIETVAKVSNRMKSVMINNSKQAHVESYLRQMSHLTDQVKQVIYARTVKKIYSKSISANGNVDYPSQIEKVNWMNMTGEPNRYVHNIIKDLDFFKSQLDAFSLEDDDKKNKNSKPSVQIPAQSVDQLWDHVIKFIMLELIEGFSRIKKCDHRGRGQMDIDLTGVSQGILKIAPPSVCKPVPYTQLVKSYIQAYYLPGTDMLDWVIKNYNPIFTAKQIRSLAEIVGAQLPKKAKQDLFTQVEKMYGHEEASKANAVTVQGGSSTSGVSSAPPQQDKSEFWSLLRNRMSTNNLNADNKS